MIDMMINDFPLSSVVVTDEYCANAFKKEVEYLASFDVDRILAGFRETAGLDTKGAERYSGWENMLIGGHCIGHYVGACVNAINTPGCNAEAQKKLLLILDSVIEGLKECQNAIGTGFLFGSTLADKNNIEAQFDHVEQNHTNIITQAWVPWYTMHKLIEGLLAASTLNPKALSVLEKLTEWIYNRTTGWTAETRRIVLGIEYGGMNDCLYNYYKISGNEKALKAAMCFDDEELFQKISCAKTGENILSGRHANTTIPKFTGALNRYVVTGEKRFLEYAENFWNLVVSAHSYVNGGNSTWEHFGEDNNLYSKLSNCNCETCNSYNMLKLTKLLYMITGKKEYADWYEHTFLNSILSSQNPESGMTTYFQPMASGYFKVYSSPFENFWCCTGTGMENFTKLGESFYFTKGKDIVVNQFISSDLMLDGKEVLLKQKSYIPNKNFSEFIFTQGFDGNLLLRIPQWCDSEVSVFVNNQSYTATQNDGYAVISGPFAADTTVKIVLPMKIKAFNLPDQQDAWAFKYGPVVLCALLGEHDNNTSLNGVNVRIPEKQLISKEYVPSESDIITVKGMSCQEFINNINSYLVRDDSCSDELKFKLLNTDSNLTYVVHYLQYKQRYGLYFRFLDEKDSRKIMEDKLSQGYINSCKLDTVQPGYGQYENDSLHKMTEYGNGSSGQTYRGTSRYAKEGGSFSYRMIVDAAGTDLLIMLDPKDNGKTLVIKAGTKVVYDSVVNCSDLKSFNKVIIPLDSSILKSFEKINYEDKELNVLTFTISGRDGKESAQLCEFVYTLRKS